ncbi:MAG: DUF4097 domain-containing protein [Oscillospiraceae bacterium]|nr:DUF4097 domain-containing protein [Oscillospiraceae bacterium]
MKPTSIIFLILSIILIACGFGLCFVANNVSRAQGIPIYAQTFDENNNSIERIDLNVMGITRISLTIKDADVFIINKAEESYIELVNFYKNTYDLKTNSKTIQLDDTINILSLLKFTENGFEFNGLRYYLIPDMYREKKKVVNIYIKEDEEIKIFDIDIKDGNLFMKDFVKRADYTVNVVKGDIYFDTIRTSSMFNLTLNEGKLTFQNCLINVINADINAGYCYFNTLSIDFVDYNLTTPLGRIYYAGEDKGGTFNQFMPMASTKLNVNVNDGDIYIEKIVRPAPPG